jgi:protein involved in polysaccharide export with SLBB domain
MKRGQRVCGWSGLSLCLLAGCALGHPHLDRALLADQGAAGRNEGVAECYTVHCPDTLAVKLADRPDLAGPRPVGPDGRIDLGSAGRLRVEGLTVPEIGRLLAQEIGVARDQVEVRVAAFRSQQVYLFGQGIGVQRAVAYEGPETVLDLLHRTGGITRGAAPNDLYVVRSHIPDDRQPEVFHINLRAILLNQDQRTNLRLQPFDQVYIGETRQASLAKCVPPCLRPLYEALCGLSQNAVVEEARSPR